MDLQRNDDWLQQRCGRITASKMQCVLEFTPGEGVFASGPRKGEPRPDVSSAARDAYRAALVSEILTGVPAETFQTYAMRWGVEQEPAALAAYINHTGFEVVGAGLCIHPMLEFVGASPDGLCVDRGIEAKCPYNSAVHVNTWLDGMPPEHMAQVQTGMWCTGMDQWDFISFDPRMPKHLQLYVETIKRDDEYIAAMHKHCTRFWDEVCERVERVQAKARKLGEILTEKAA